MQPNFLVGQQMHRGLLVSSEAGNGPLAQSFGRISLGFVEGILSENVRVPVK